MGCDWQNQERAASNHSESQTPLASNAGCIGRAARPQTNCMQDVLTRFAMMNSSQLPSDVPAESDYKLGAWSQRTN